MSPNETDQKTFRIESTYTDEEVEKKTPKKLKRREIKGVFIHQGNWRED